MLCNLPSSCSLLALTLIWLVSCQLVNSTRCNAGIYGIPDYYDCQQTFAWVSYMGLIEPGEAAQPRLFAEPQYMGPPFSGVYNVYRPNAIVQLPKIWKHSTYNLVQEAKSSAFPLLPRICQPYTSNSETSFCPARQSCEMTKRCHDTADSCRVALVSEGSTTHYGAIEPIFVATWKDVINQALQLKICLYPGSSQGGYTPLACTSQKPGH